MSFLEALPYTTQVLVYNQVDLSNKAHTPYFGVHYSYYTITVLFYVIWLGALVLN